MYSKVKNTFIFLLGKHNARNAAIVTTTLTLASRLFSYVKILLIAYFFGASAFVDAYYIAYGAIFFITGTMQGTLESAVLPKLVQNDKEHYGLGRTPFRYFLFNNFRYNYRFP